MEVRLITLDRTPERRAGFLRRNRHLSRVRPLPARDGSRLDRDDLVRREIVTPDLPYTPGAIGCALSHLTLWSETVDRGVPVTVAEDDAVFCRNFEHEAARLIATLPRTGRW